MKVPCFFFVSYVRPNFHMKFLFSKTILLVFIVQMHGVGQGFDSIGSTPGELDDQNFATKDQRSNKEAMLKVTRTKKQPLPGTKTLGVQQTR